MVENINGTWKMISSEGFDDYMKALGVNSIARKMIKLVKPKAIFSIKDKDYSYKSVSTVRTMEIKCRLGEEFIETIPDGNKTKSLIVEENGKIVHTQKWEGKETIITRYVDGQDQLIMEFQFQDVKSRRVFERVQ